jgi:hypothetical protein
MSQLGTLTKILIFTCVLSTPVYAYVTLRGLSSTNSIVQIKWLSSPISWQMNPTAGPNISGPREVGDIIRQSFRAWSSISTAVITFAEGSPTTDKFGYDGKNVIVTNLSTSEWSALGLGQSVLAFTAVHWSDTGSITDRLGQHVAFPGQIMDADIVFNPSYEFITDETLSSNRVDFQSVMTHEIGHFLGLDHSPSVSSTMFWATYAGESSQRTLTADDIVGVSSIYPSASFLSKGTLKGVVRTTANVPVYGAVVLAINSGGQSVGSAITDPTGQYSIMGLDPGLYTVFAGTLETFTTSGNFYTLSEIYPGQTVATGFTGRFR